MVVSNREPYIHISSGDEIQCVVPASGLTVALDPMMRACSGVWVAHGSGNADRKVVDAKNRVSVPPDEPSYSLRRIWLTKEEEEGYYLGLSNEALWPLCHVAYTPPIFDEADWNTYKKVNQLFADAVLDEVGDRKAFVFIQDYHLAILSRLIKAKNPQVITAQFWHIPWPNPEVFRICPWQEELLDGLLGNDLLGFHIGYNCDNFLETVNRNLESKIDYERSAVNRGGGITLVRPFPISVDFDRIARDAAKEEVIEEMERIRHRWKLDDEFIGVGVDRVDYTKGIPHRLMALDKFLTKYPEYQGRMVFVQLAEPSRVHIRKYKELNADIDDLVEEINWKYQSGGWRPIIYIKEHCSPLAIWAFHRLAHFCIVSSLHDGMNLVAKEFVSSRVDEDGVLILSRFTGAARELVQALLINPYATDDFVETIRKAVEMPKRQRQARMRKLRQSVEQNNIYQWAGNIISELANLGL
ncbi:MAG TPA: trehalose-6-phosphate synthase [Dehalococcoidia bacterium]|nr:trehalose-6-phosphate synthase [Dehalococcoidia bacterium]